MNTVSLKSGKRKGGVGRLNRCSVGKEEIQIHFLSVSPVGASLGEGSERVRFLKIAFNNGKYVRGMGDKRVIHMLLKDRTGITEGA